jgi:hypothetical protein
MTMADGLFHGIQSPDDEQIAEEVTQDVFQCLEKSSSYDVTGKVSTWISVPATVPSIYC